MKFEVYCDESFPDVFTSSSPKARHLLIGSLWLPKDLRTPIKEKIKELREEFDVWGEIKWNKVSRGSLDFYFGLINLFTSYNSELRFRCIAVNAEQMNMALHDNDAELGFYKFYYQLLHHWISDFNEYTFFCDIKTNRDPDRLKTLRQCLSCANMSSEVHQVQSLPSGQVALIQLADLLLGCAAARINETLEPGSAREQLVIHLEEKLGRAKITPTHKAADKFNVFKIQLSGGW